MNNNNNALKRSLTLPLITFYGLGNILGAGIYVLVGKVAGDAGYFAPLSFFVASIIAAISALTYAELSARYPVSAGEAVYLYEGFGLRWLSLVVGLLIVSAGMVSAAAIAHGFAGYFKVLMVSFFPAFQAVPSAAIIAVLIVVLGILAIWGISQSVRVASFLTLLEITGLGLVIWVGLDNMPLLDQSFQAIPESGYGFSFVGVFAGAFLAFYAYLGFEDMVNIAEEVKNPQYNMPRAIMLAVIISTLLYSGVSIVSVLLVEPGQLAQSAAPLADVYTSATGRAPVVISLIGMFAVINGALIQMIMASRLLYGMGSRGWLPRWIARIHPPTRTPVNSTLVVMSLIMLSAISLPLVTLAELCSFLILIVFALINLALIKIKHKQPQPEGVRVFPVWIPKLGFGITVTFLLLNLIRNLF
ncbi:MAG: amino acid permease [Gammaproteobacteria bacterium]|nr:amino acid permease [Gammaproteobacteria bacterium]MDH5734829.1 amino acid permease [Gammaproteobacteria bacterium]